MARKKTESDRIYNTRRRLARAADRYLKQAEKATGAQAARLRTLGERLLRDAASTYQGGKLGGKVAKIAEKFSVDVSTPEKVADRELAQARKRAERAKFRFTEAERRKQQAEAIFNSPIGSRIIGAFESVWNVEGREGTILDAIMRKLGVSDALGVIEAVEAVVGEALYKSPGDIVKYDEVLLAIRSAFRL